MDGDINGSMVRDAMEDFEGEFETELKDTQLVPCRLFLHWCDLDLETLIDTGAQRFKALAFELG